MSEVECFSVETWDAVRARRNVRRYTDRPIASDDLDRIVEAGRRSPSSMNEQRWDFIVCTGRQQLVELAKVWQYGTHVATSAATVAVVVPNSDDPGTRESVEYDVGQATMSMMVAAADLGIGSSHSAVADQELARRVLGHPEDRLCTVLIAFGYPADRPLAPIKQPKRRPFDEVIHRDHW